MSKEHPMEALGRAAKVWELEALERRIRALAEDEDRDTTRAIERLAPYAKKLAAELWPDPDAPAPSEDEQLVEWVGAIRRLPKRDLIGDAENLLRTHPEITPPNAPFEQMTADSIADWVIAKVEDLPAEERARWIA